MPTTTRAKSKPTKRTPRARVPSKHGIQLPPRGIEAQGFNWERVRTGHVTMWDWYVTHPGSGLTPEKMISVFRAAEAGYPLQQCDAFEDIVENDGHLRSLLEARTLAVAGKDWQVQAGGDGPADIRAAEELQVALRETNVDDMFAHMLSARYYGYAASEIVWERRGGAVVPTWFVNLPHRRLVFDEQDRPRMLDDESSTPETSPLLDQGKWVYGRNSGAGLTVRSGLLRTAAWYALFKRWSWRDWVIYAEKFGIPLTLGIYEIGATEADIAALKKAVVDIGEAGQAVLSSAAKVDVREAQRGGDSNGLHKAIVEAANAEMSKLITGSTLTVETGSSGSYAQAKVHESRSFDLVVADAAWLSRRFRADIARTYLSLNGYPAGTKSPELAVQITRETDPLTRVKLAETLLAMGLTLDEEQLRQEFQFRAPPDGGRALTKPVAPAAPASAVEIDDE